MIKPILAVFAIVAVAAMMGAVSVAPAYAATLIEDTVTNLAPPTYKFYQTICNVYPVYLTLTSTINDQKWDNNKEYRLTVTNIIFTDTVGDTIGTGTATRSETWEFQNSPLKVIVADDNQFSCSNGQSDIDAEVNEQFDSTTTYNIDGTMTIVYTLETNQPGEPNVPPTISATATSPIDESTSTLLDGTADDPDGINSNMTFSWVKTSGQGGSIDNDNQLDATFNAPNIGGPGADRDYVFTLTVTDEGGAESTTTVNITVVNSD